MLGWDGHVDGEIVVHEIPGDHLSMNTGESLTFLGAELRNSLEAAKFGGPTESLQCARILDTSVKEVGTL
jgi:hypothetical protein